MSKPKEEVREKEYYKEIHFLYEIFGTLKNVDELKSFLKDILTRSELRMLKRRWHIANLLHKGLEIRTIAYQTQTSTQTVSRVKKILEEGYGGLQIALERAKEKEKKDKEHFIKSKQSRQSSKFVKGWFK